MHVLILGAGFGGLELATSLTESLGNDVNVTLIEKNDSFVFGFSKLDAMFGRVAPEQIHIPYREMTNPAIDFRQETVTAIDPVGKRVSTTEGEYVADVLVVALGADYDFEKTPGVGNGAGEFYSVEGGKRMSQSIADFKGGTAVVAVTTAHFKCPPAPCETAMLLRQNLVKRGLADNSRVVLITPWAIPIPVSQSTSAAILSEFGSCGIEFMGESVISDIDVKAKSIEIADGRSVSYDLVMIVPVHKAPDVVLESGMTVDGWIPVDPDTMQTSYPDVYAVGDVATVGVPKAGVFSEGQARIVASQLIAQARSESAGGRYLGQGTCYVEMGDRGVGRVDVDFRGGPSPRADFTAPTVMTAAEKAEFGATRRARWFGA